MASKKVEANILSSIHVKIFPRGIKRFCGNERAKVDLDWLFERIRETIDQVCEENEGEKPDDCGNGNGDGHYYCVIEPAPDAGPGCIRRVCYDEFGNEVYRGPAQCPPQEPQRPQ